MQTGRGPLQHGCTTMLQQLLNPNWVIAMSHHVWTQQIITFHCRSEEYPFFAHPVGSSVNRHCIHDSEDLEDTVVSTSIMKRKFKHEQPKPTNTGMSGPMWRNNTQLTSLQLTVILEEEGNFPQSKQVGFLPDEVLMVISLNYQAGFMNWLVAGWWTFSPRQQNILQVTSPLNASMAETSIA